MRTTTMRALVGMLALAGATTLGLTTGTARAEAIKFDDAAGAPPAGWQITMTGKGAPRWLVEKDAARPRGGNVLRQSGTATYPLALKHRHGRQGRLRRGEIQGDRAARRTAPAGIVWRVKDKDNYYVVRANALEDNVVLYKTSGGKRSALDIVGRKGGYGVKAPVPPNEWHTLRVEFAATRFKVDLQRQAAVRGRGRDF